MITTPGSAYYPVFPRALGSSRELSGVRERLSAKNMSNVTMFLHHSRYHAALRHCTTPSRADDDAEALSVMMEAARSGGLDDGADFEVEMQTREYGAAAADGGAQRARVRRRRGRPLGDLVRNPGGRAWAYVAGPDIARDGSLHLSNPRFLG